MSKIRNKENEKKLIIMIVIIMLFNFVMPNYSQAVGNIFFKPIAQFIAHVSDLVIQGLQGIFIGDTAIRATKNKYLIRYSPGIIFTGAIPSFDINFINPMSDMNITLLSNDLSEYSYNLVKFMGGNIHNDANISTILSGLASPVEENGIMRQLLKTGYLVDKNGNKITDVYIRKI